MGKIDEEGFKIEADLTPDQVLAKIQQIVQNPSITAIRLDLGTSHKTVILQDEAVEKALVNAVVSTWKERPWKRIQVEFSSPGYIPFNSKKEDKFFKLENKAKNHTSQLGRKIQRALDLDETEVRVDGDVHQDIEANSDILHQGVGIISFPKVLYNRETDEIDH